MAQVKFLKIASNLPTEHTAASDDLTVLSLSTDTVSERTGAAGVTVDGVLLKDFGATLAADLKIWEATNDANPEVRIGSADAEEGHIQAIYDTGAQTLSHVLFATDVASATADKGKFLFNVDAVDIGQIDDGGVDLVTGMTYSINGTSVLSGSTLGSGVTASSLTSVGTITTGTWNGTDIAVADGGTGRGTATAYAVLCGGTTSTGAHQSIASVGNSGEVLTSNGAGALPTFQAAGAASNSEAYTNGNAGSIVLGDVVYMTSTNNTVDLADADTIAQGQKIVGIAAATIASSASGNIHVAVGKVIAGVLSAATAGTPYYLSTTGTSTNTMTTTAPSGGPAIVQLGIAKNATDLIWNPVFIADSTA